MLRGRLRGGLLLGLSCLLGSSYSCLGIGCIGALTSKTFKMIKTARGQGILSLSALKSVNDEIFCKCLSLFNAACWGVTYISTKAGIDALRYEGVENAACVFQFVRWLLCAGCLLPWLKGSSCRESMRVSALVGILNALGYFSISIAYTFGTSGSKAAFITSLQAIVVAVMTSCLKGRWQSGTLLSSLLAVLGVGCLVLSGGAEISAGDFLALGTPFFMGLAWHLLGDAMKKFPDDSIASVAVQFFVLALFFGCWLVVSSLQQGLSFNFRLLLAPTVLTPLLFTSFFGSVLTMCFANRAMRALSTSQVVIICTSEPLWGAIAAVLVLGETLGVSTVVGGVLIILALLCNELLQEKEEVKVLDW